MKSATRTRHTSDAIRAGLTQLGLREEEKPFSGYAFTHWKEPQAAVALWKEQHGGMEPRRFYIGRREFILSA